MSHDLDAETDRFLVVCRELRALGATSVRIGYYSARFSPLPKQQPQQQPGLATAPTIPAPTQTRVPHTKSEPESDVPRFPEDTQDDVDRRRKRAELTELVSGT